MTVFTVPPRDVALEVGNELVPRSRAVRAFLAREVALTVLPDMSAGNKSSHEGASWLTNKGVIEPPHDRYDSQATNEWAQRVQQVQ